MRSFNTCGSPPIPYQFETFISTEAVKEFIRCYWHYSIYISVFYLIAAYLLREYMKPRAAFHLTKSAVIWNGMLALFSIYITIRFLPLCYFILTCYPFYSVLCNKTMYELPQFTFIQIPILCSKVWELGDTFLIILKKRKLMFLHLFHHTTVLLISWYALYRDAILGAPLMYLDLVVHSFFYSYFAVKSMNIKISVKISMLITVMQMLLMLSMFLFSCWISWQILNGHECDISTDCLLCFLILFLVYMVLFFHLFYKSYICTSFGKKRD